MRNALALGLLLLGGAAIAEPLRVSSGETMRVRVDHRYQSAVGLRPKANGAWRLGVRAAHGERAEVYDVTDGVAPNKWLVDISSSQLVFDSERFFAGHAYRVVVHGDEALVYLYPPTRGRSSRVVFADPDDDHPRGSDDSITIAPKSAL
jgi:hypothetical protein